MDGCRCRKEAAFVCRDFSKQRPGKEARMQETLLQRLVRRAGIVGLAVLMIMTSAGLAYVAHLTQVTPQNASDGRPSVLPLVVLSILSAIAGIATLRTAMQRDVESV
jgi:hypothetical protein